MKGDITGRLQETKLHRLDKPLIEYQLLSSDFPLYWKRERREAKLSELPIVRPLHKQPDEKALWAPLHSLLTQIPRSPSQPAFFQRILYQWTYDLVVLYFCNERVLLEH